nr:sulfatase-like hydrolase/transferase [Polaribacter batillariae]
MFLVTLSLFSKKAQRPNIIFIMSDDHSVGATGAYGNSLVPTPNIDRLADQGMIFNNCFNVISICGMSSFYKPRLANGGR